MSKRLQVVMDEEEWQANADAARDAGLTLSEWVRQVMRQARPHRRRKSRGEILGVLEWTATINAPVPDTVEEMNAEIETGYLSGKWPRG